MPSPKFPLYIPSKGRHENMMTSKALTTLGLHHHIIVEPQEVAAYAAAIETMNIDASILELDQGYKDRYELCDDLGLTKSTGAGPARNFAWDHSIGNGFSHHWVMDDNIRSFKRLTEMRRIKVLDGTIFCAMEDFMRRYTNVYMSGPAYSMFAFGSKKIPPFITNTRIYSCNLIRNDIPFRWRGRYNEDTILSLDILKAGFCTIQFNAFLQEKMQTQSLKGGNTDELYRGGTVAKSKMMLATHPDVARMRWRFGRCHHYVNYHVFRKNKLRRRTDVVAAEGVNSFGMVLTLKPDRRVPQQDEAV